MLEERWLAVEAVAHALLESGEVPGEAAERIIVETRVPAPVESVWADLQAERRREA